MTRLRDHRFPLDDSVEARDGFLSLLGAKLRNELEAPDDVSLLAIEGILIEAMAAVARLKSFAAGPRVPGWLSDVRDVLHTRFVERLELSELATIAAVHPGHVARVFRKAYRCSVGDYVRRLRIDFACRELAGTDNPLGHIAVAAGFSDQSHLTRTFRRHLGITPAKYRALFVGRLPPYREPVAIQDACQDCSPSPHTASMGWRVRDSMVVCRKTGSSKQLYARRLATHDD